MPIARILVADSSPLVRERMVAALIHALGEARVEEADSHHEMLDVLERFSPHVVLFDAGLSHDSVADLVARTSRGGASNGRVVVLASDRLGYAAHCLDAGAAEVVDRSDSDSAVRAVKTILHELHAQPPTHPRIQA